MPETLYRVQVKPIHIPQFIESVKKTPGMEILSDVPLKIPAYKTGWSEDYIRRTKFLKHYLVKFRSCSSASEFILKHGTMSKRPYHGVERFYFNGTDTVDSGDGTVKDDYYYWTHPKEYVRLKAEDMKTEPMILLCETILDGLRKEINHFLVSATRFPNDPKVKVAAKEFKRSLETQFITAITFGRAKELLKELEEKLPRGMMD